MSFSRSKISRFSDPKDTVPASVNGSTTSTNSKLIKKSSYDKEIPPKSARNVTKLPPFVRPRSLPRSKSPTVTNTTNSRPCSVSGIKMARTRRESLDLEKADDDLIFQSATVLPFTDNVSTKEEEKSIASNHSKEIISNTSESKNNISGIPLRIKSSHGSNKESSTKIPRQEVKKITSMSHLSNLSSSTLSRKKYTAKGGITINRNSTLITQFERKKKQLLTLQDELISKKGVLTDSYNTLVELKERLEESGVTNIELNKLKFEISTKSLEPAIIEDMTDALNKISSTLVDICKNLLSKRVLLLNTLEDFSKYKLSQDELQKCLKKYKEDTVALETLVGNQFNQQQDLVTHLVEKWRLLFIHSGDTASILNQVDELKEKLKGQESKLTSTKKKLKHMTQENEICEHKISQAEANENCLKEKLERLEQELAYEKQSALSYKEKCTNFDLQKKVMKAQIQEWENKCKESENKHMELQTSYMHAEEQIKTNEQTWMKQKEELISKNKHDKQLLEKFTKERSFFETRVKTLEENITEADNAHKAIENKLNGELEDARNFAAEEKIKKDTLQQKYEQVQNKLAQMEMRNNQAIKTRNTLEQNEMKSANEREAQLYADLLGTRMALKAAEEKLQNYDKEKSLQNEKTSNNESTLQNAQKLTELENLVTEKDKIIYKRQVEITNLTAEVRNLKLKVSVPQCGDSTSEECELKRTLHEDTAKLENLVRKSSENEEKAISFQHELDNRTKQLYDMENLLRARDGLITLLKVKKEELQSENSSLHRCVGQIRTLLMQRSEEVRTKSDLLEELTINLNSKECENKEQEKKIMELECSLSIANGNPFKLQDTESVMENYLQSTKAHITRMSPKTNSRYDNINPHQFQSNNVTFPKIRRNNPYTVNPTTVAHTRPRSSGASSTSETKSFTSITSPTFDDIDSHYLESEAVRSWLNSYRNFDDIQKRLKFLKSAFASLSKKMNFQDMKLKQASKSLVGIKSCEKFTQAKPSSSFSYGLHRFEQPQKRERPLSKFHKLRKSTQRFSSTMADCCEWNDEFVSDRNNPPISKRSPTKIRPTPDLYFNKVIKNKLPNPTDGMSSAPIPTRPFKSPPIFSPIPVPKVRYSPLTLSSRPCVKSIVTPKFHEECTDIPLSRNTYQNHVSAYQNRSYLSLYLNRGSSVQPSVIVEQHSRDANYERCHQHNIPHSEFPIVPNIQSTSDNNLVSKSFIQIATQRNYSQFDSSTDSTGSNLSVATVIKCSEFINKCNDIFISESEYILKLYAENQPESGDYSHTDGVQYLPNVDGASSSNAPNAHRNNGVMSGCLKTDLNLS